MITSKQCFSAVFAMFIASFFTASFSGCGGNPNLFHASGKVTLDGKPVEKAFVTFIPMGSGSTSYGKTDAEGRYEMKFTDRLTGAWQGQNRVEIKTGDVGTGGEPAPRERIPSAYNTASTLVAEVKSGNNVFDFELKSDASKIVQPKLE